MAPRFARTRQFICGIDVADKSWVGSGLSLVGITGSLGMLVIAATVPGRGRLGGNVGWRLTFASGRGARSLVIGVLVVA